MTFEHVALRSHLAANPNEKLSHGDITRLSQQDEGVDETEKRAREVVQQTLILASSFVEAPRLCTATQIVEKMREMVASFDSWQSRNAS